MKIIHTTQIDSPELQIFSGLSEPQLIHYFEPAPGIFIAESPMIIRRALDAGYEPMICLAEDTRAQEVCNLFSVADRSSGAEENSRGDRKNLISGVSPAEDLPVYLAPLSVLTRITGFALTRGILCAMRRKTLPHHEEILSGSSRIVVLENVMNPTNVGAIFRSAAALGMDGILLTKGCTDPFYRRAARVSMGTVFQIPWTCIPDGPSATSVLHEKGFLTAAMALGDHCKDLSAFHPDKDEKIAIFLGTEGPGLCAETLKRCDLSFRIPMYHGVDSLNVAAAGAVAFWHLGPGRQISSGSPL
ncbi:MAG: RNA methyltransferase [Parasporobacterium sp.]|nr:RNA methyltransferase [Parasporobacterium sp.]MBQ9032962.1 RNA methyltransferase [Parasporobacterium sp.]